MSPLSSRARLTAIVLLLFTILVMSIGNQDRLPVGLTWNRTPSLPIGLYWHTPMRSEIQYDDMVCFSFRAPTWAMHRRYVPPGMLVCKHVFGRAGDQLIRQGTRLQICGPAGCRDAGEIRRVDSQGAPVTAAELPAVIPTGHVYLGSTRTAMSLDSRYLGLISTNDLKRTIHPLWVRE